MYKCSLIFTALICLSSLCLGASTEGKIEVTGGKVWYRIAGSGSGTPLLLIHGGPGGSSCALTPLTATLGNTRPIIFYDQLGAGKSDHPKDSSLWQIHRFVDELNQVIKKLGFQKVHLLAHSWGAAIAGQYLMEKGTNGIASVIYVGPLLNSKDWIEGTNDLKKQLSPRTQAILKKHESNNTTNSDEYQQATDEFYQKFLFHHPSTNSSDCDDSSWNQSIYEQMWGDSEFQVTGNLKNFDATQHLADIKIPTLFMVGEFDEAREYTVRKYQQQMTNASIEVVKNAAHMSMIDEPKEFTDIVNRFLKGVDAKTSNAQPILKQL